LRKLTEGRAVDAWNGLPTRLTITVENVGNAAENSRRKTLITAKLTLGNAVMPRKLRAVAFTKVAAAGCITALKRRN
jgi:hypothetical protein